MQRRFRKSLFGVGERMDILSRFFAVPGALFLRWIGALGDAFLFLLEGLRQIFIAPKLFIKVLQQLYVIGTKSLFVICLIALFTGMVLGLQGYYVLVKFGSVGVFGGRCFVDAHPGAWSRPDGHHGHGACGLVHGR